MISIEGNIGAGKTFLCDLLKANDVKVSQEPVNEWKIGKINILDHFYKNPTKYAYVFQTLVLRTRVEQVRGMENCIIERSVQSDGLFGGLQHSLGNMDDVEYASYLYQYEQAIQDTPAITQHIYIKTSIDVCIQRISKRNRGQENKISENYLRKLEMAHERWLNGLDNVLVLNGNADWTDPQSAKSVVSKVKRFIM